MLYNDWSSQDVFLYETCQEFEILTILNVIELKSNFLKFIIQTPSNGFSQRMLYYKTSLKALFKI